MSIASRMSNLFRRRKGRGTFEDSYIGRREFVYLDEVSVLSILASADGRNCHRIYREPDILSE